MADYSFGYGGVGSGLDISGIVNQLVAADRAPHDNRLNKLETNAKFKLSGLGTVTSAFDGLKTALDALQKPEALGARTVSSRSTTGTAPTGTITDTVLGATVGGNTPLGRYEVVVEQLATAHKLVGDGLDKTTKFGAGTLRVGIGADVVEVTVAKDATLTDIRNAITAAAGKHGVQAALLTSDEGQHLSLGSAKTGAAHAITLSVIEGDSDLHGLVDGLTEQVPAADAKLSIDGLVTTSASNTVTDAVQGLTLKLKDAGTSIVEVAANPAGSRAAVEGFVKAYNAALNAITTATSYNAETKTPSSLTGDAQMRGAGSQLRGMMSELLGELAAQGLDAKTLGLQTQGHPNPNGNLVLDAAKFDAAMAENPAKIAAAFTGETGIASRLNVVVKTYVGKEGSFTSRKDSLDGQVKDVAKQREALETRMEGVAERYKAQFVALDKLMAQMSTTNTYLAQQLTALSAQTSQ
ncbi:flagellar filament capping protein FliD [Luteimonas sp. S4-F44]|uniref:flagellar filament capping protein FliD n=1 Tax=Luteimonas sp. S4-F44 TaxID=2925842 RepID=UPI001F52E6AB|nr:flagellar filament capping protein FliD [Luteimonas sp. S4-F44]UNK43971.1 flagellar filament capping protein FliD [Luteimonas sp. S4-F44]